MYQIEKLLKYKNLFHAFSQKSDGNMANSINGNVHDFAKVAENRKHFLEKIGIDINKTTCMWGVHGDEIIEPPPQKIGVSMVDYRKAAKVDGLVTNKTGLYLFLLIADCLPVIIYDPVKQVVSLIHAGWRGVDLNIVGKGVMMFKSKYKSKSTNIVVGIGPCAHKESFIKESPSQKDDPKWNDYIIKTDDNKYSVDLIGMTKKQLADGGILHDKIFDSNIDTVKDGRFFSHVRESVLPIEKQGRFACVVGLKQ